MRIRKGDNVKVISGKDKGKTGIVEKVYLMKEKILVTGVNAIKKHKKSSGNSNQSGIIDTQAPIAISNVQLICNKCNKPTRLTVKRLDDKARTRICKKCSQDVNN
jgi:large subunit ribosomal protein L24